MPRPQTGASHALLGHPDKGCTIKGLVDCIRWDISLVPLDLLNCLVPRGYQPYMRYGSYDIDFVFTP